MTILDLAIITCISLPWVAIAFAKVVLGVPMPRRLLAAIVVVYLGIGVTYWLTVSVNRGSLMHTIGENTLAAFACSTPVAAWGYLVYAMVTRSLRKTPRPCACGRCGYSLLGNRSGVCPECGLPTPLGTRD